MRKFSMLVGLLVAVGFTGSAMAAAADYGLAVTGDAHAGTGFQFRGSDYSNNSPSVGVKVGAVHQSGVFGSLSLDTVNLSPLVTDGGRSYQAFTNLKAGYAQQVGDVTLSAGVSQYLFTGRRDASDRNFTEVFGQADYRGATFKLARNIAGASNYLVPGQSRNDTYAELGYTYQYGKFNVGADLGYTWYGNRFQGTKDGLSLAQVRVGYEVSKDFSVRLTHELSAAKDAFGAKASANNETYLSATYKF